MKGLYLGILLLTLLIYIYVVYIGIINYDQIQLDNINNFKTGDLILFKAYDNINNIFTGCYYGHIGIVYVIDNIPYLFEAAGTRGMFLRSDHNKSGIFLQLLIPRIQKYKGKVFWKRLNNAVPKHLQDNFSNFINYAKQNMYYRYNVISSSIERKILNMPCSNGTNCGELVFLSLIKLKLLNIKKYYTFKFHYLKWMCNIIHLDGNNNYLPPVQIVDHPF